MTVAAPFLSAVCKEPYRLFFPLGILAASLGIIHWALYAKGFITTYSGFFHSSMLTMVYMNCFIGGFLMTSFPRFTQSKTAAGWEIGALCAIFFSITAALYREQWVIAESGLLVFYAFLLWFVLSRVLNRPRPVSPSRGEPPLELVWVPIAFLIGILGVVILMLGQTKVLPVWALKVGKPMMDQGFLTCLVAGVGGFLIPRLMGTYDDSSTKKAGGKLQYYLMCASLLLVSFFIEGLYSPAMGYGLRAAAVTAAFLKCNVLGKIPRHKGLYVWMAMFSVWMVVIGFWGASLLTSLQTLMLHFTFLGGFSLMIFAIASMVILSHSGEGERLDGHVWALWAVFIGVCAALTLRFLVVIFPDSYFQLLGISSTIWVLSALVWLGFMLPRVLRVPDEDEFERMHEMAKSKLKGGSK